MYANNPLSPCLAGWLAALPGRMFPVRIEHRPIEEKEEEQGRGKGGGGGGKGHRPGGKGRGGGKQKEDDGKSILRQRRRVDIHEPKALQSTINPNPNEPTA